MKCAGIAPKALRFGRSGDLHLGCIYPAFAAATGTAILSPETADHQAGEKAQCRKKDYTNQNLLDHGAKVVIVITTPGLALRFRSLADIPGRN